MFVGSESNVEERKLLTESLDLIHDILADINQQVDSQHKHERLHDICRRIDSKAFTMYRGNKFKVRFILFIFNDIVHKVHE